MHLPTVNIQSSCVGLSLPDVSESWMVSACMMVVFVFATRHYSGKSVPSKYSVKTGLEEAVLQ